MRLVLAALAAAAVLSLARSGGADDAPDAKLVTVEHLTGPLWVVKMIISSAKTRCSTSGCRRRP